MSFLMVACVIASLLSPASTPRLVAHLWATPGVFFTVADLSESLTEPQVD